MTTYQQLELAVTQSPAVYRYYIKSTDHSSAKFGPCQVCGQHCAEVFYQYEEQQYTPDQDEIDYIKESGIKVDGFWTRYKCGSWFGHKECLEGQRRDNDSN